MFYPIMLNIHNKIITIIGGGEVALRKTINLLNYDVDIRVISPTINSGFNELNNKIKIIKDTYNEKYIKDSFVVIGATSCKETNEKIARYCKNNKILCNIVDNKELSDFIVPSTIERGSLKISISTEGKSPSLSAKIRREIEEKYPVHFEEYLEVLWVIRELVIKKCNDKKRRKEILNEIVNLNLQDLNKRRIEYENSSRI